MKTKRTFIFLFTILFFSLILRLYNLGSLPASLNPDEAALGYTAFSFLNSGRDEHGKFLPASLESFGDWKLPVYSYVALFPVSIMGLTEISVRLPSAISGVISVWLIYQISSLLFKKKEISLIASCFYALSPWNIYFSRVAYEVNLGVTFFLAGLFLLLNILYNKELGYKRVNLYGFLSVILFGLTLFTYHSFIIITPLFISSLIMFFRNEFRYRKLLIAHLLIFILIVAASLLNTLSSGSNKFTTLSILNNKDIRYSRVELLRGDKAEKNLFIEKFLHFKYAGSSYQFGQNYIDSFSPDFLFDRGGEKLVHNIGTFGHLYLIDVLFLFSGMAFLFWNREKAIKLLLIWLVVSPIPSSLTKDTPNATRLYIMMPLYTLVSSYGAYYVATFLKNQKSRIILSLTLIILFIVSVVYFLDSYFIHFNTQRIRFWRYGHREIVKLTNQYPDYNVVFRGPENFPYIYFLFYNSYNPAKFQNHVEYYPYTPEGFHYVKSFDRYRFVEEINYKNIQNRTIYIDDRLNKNFETVNLPSGEPILYYKVYH